MIAQSDKMRCFVLINKIIDTNLNFMTFQIIVSVINKSSEVT